MMLWTFIAVAKMCSKARHLLCNPTIQAVWKIDMKKSQEDDYAMMTAKLDGPGSRYTSGFMIVARRRIQCR